MSKKKNYSKKLILQAIKGSNGIVSNIAKSLQCDWHTAENYVNKWPETIQAYKDEEEFVLDFAESKVMDSIRKGNTADAKWYLSKKGKARGYGDDNQPELFDNLDDSPDEDIKIIIDDGPEEETNGPEE